MSLGSEGHSNIGKSLTTSVMNSFHIGAGTRPPDTFLNISPFISTSVRGSCSSAKPIQTDDVYWGINPINQASLNP